MRSGRSLMSKLVVYFLIIILIMFSINIYSVYRFKAFYSSFYSMLSNSVGIQSISMEVDDLYSQVENYINSGNDEYSDMYSVRYDKLMERITGYQEDLDVTSYYHLRDIRNILLTFNEKSLAIIDDYNRGMGRIYLNRGILELAGIKGYIQNEINESLLYRLKGILNYYSGFWTNLQIGEALSYLIVVLITLLCLFFAYRFSRQISIPIHQLVLQLKRVARGDLDTERLSFNKNDEINVLIESFNNMITQIKSLIERIREKANIESQLKEQEIKNLEMSNLLNQSELNFLQSQINPHFLFNTLNSIGVLADIEEAATTKKMIESISNILRYNLRKLNELVTLEEELEIIKSYLYIQHVRYGNRIEYRMDIDEGLLGFVIPSMIIQPFVENAILHGLEYKEGKGLLELGVHDLGEKVRIMIRDNGVGISAEKLQEILEKSSGSKPSEGIGVANVLRRLEIYYGKDAISIESQPGKGTTIWIRLPKA